MTTLTRTNSLRDLRLQLGVRQSDLAMEAGCSRHALLRMEQLCYPNPLPNVISALSDLAGVDGSDLVTSYLKDVRTNRIVSGELWGLADFDLNDLIPLTKRPMKGGLLFQMIREVWANKTTESYSQIHFSSRFSIHPAVLSKYEAGETFAMPEMIIHALSEAGLDTLVVNYFANSTVFNGPGVVQMRTNTDD